MTLIQTFLPYPNFALSAQVLDDRRLGKQRVETLQILKSLTVPGYGWTNHPAVKMWAGYESALARYGQIICLEWINRGFRDSCYLQISAFRRGVYELPPWFGRRDIHLSHQSALLRKMPERYSKFFPETPSDIQYVWP